MNGILDRNIRKLIKDNLRLLNAKFKHVDDRDIRITDLDELFKISRSIRRESKKKIKENMPSQLTLSYINICCCFFITASIYKENDDNSLLSPTWISPSGRPNPNTVIGFLVTQLVHFSLAVVELVENGLDNPAKALSRSVSELSYQILILLSSRQDLIKYVEPESFEGTKEVWFKLFGKNRLQKKISKLEDTLNFHPQSMKILKDRRREDHQYFSESVHHAWIRTVVGSITWDFKEDKGAWSSLGGASQQSESTINHLNHTLVYFIQVFFQVTFHVHNISLENSKDYYWKEAIILKECISNLLDEGIG